MYQIYNLTPLDRNSREDELYLYVNTELKTAWYLTTEFPSEIDKVYSTSFEGWPYSNLTELMERDASKLVIDKPLVIEDYLEIESTNKQEVLDYIKLKFMLEK